MEDWSVQLTGIQKPPLADASDMPGTTLGSRASPTARLILFVLHPNTMMESSYFHCHKKELSNTFSISQPTSGRAGVKISQFSSITLQMRILKRN